MNAIAKPPSPFLPGTHIQFAWDSTSLGYLKTCPRLYQYQMIEGWVAKDENIHLYFGNEYHRALQEYDIAKAKGVGHDQAVRSAIADLLIRTHGWDPDPDTKAGKYKNRRSLLMAVCWYLENFRTDPTQTYILENGKPAVELSFKFELDWGPTSAYRGGEIEDDENGKHETTLGRRYNIKSNPGYSQPYLLCGHLDRVVIFNDDLFVMDRKTSTTTLSQFYFNQFQPNNQMSLYSIASQVVIPSPVRGVIIDACQILMGSARFVRDITQRTKGQLSEWLVDLRYHLALAETYASKGYWPQNDTACDKFGGCKFRGVCSKDPNVRKQFLKADFVQLPEEERWNPLKPR